MTQALNRFIETSPYWPVVRHPTIRRLLPSFVLSSLGDGMAVVAVSWFALQLAPKADQSVWAAMAVAAYTLPGAVGALALGRFLRHRSPARLAGWDAVLRACALGVIPLAYALGGLSIGLYIGLLAASSVLHSWGQAGIYTLIARVLPEHDHLAGNAVLSTIGSFSTIVGPMVAAPLIALGGAATVIAVDAATFAALAATFLFLLPRELPDTAHERNTEEPSRSTGLLVIRRNPKLLGLLALSFGFFLLFGPVYVALPLHVSEELGGSAALLSMFYTSFGFGALVGGMLTGYLSHRRLWPTTIGIVITFGAVMLPIGLGVPSFVALASFAAAGMLWPPYASLSTALFQRSAPPALLPQVLATSSSVRVLSVPLGTALGGPLVAALGGGDALLLAATGILMLGLIAAVGVAGRASIGSRKTLEVREETGEERGEGTGGPGDLKETA
ncbi:MFS transporter [Streptomyces sp. NPDC007929]|uniref:MFS transporter n=1 Tax=unclassified Streptomyces TaxID=2593676 RepID=UPI0036EE3D04